MKLNPTRLGQNVNNNYTRCLKKFKLIFIRIDSLSGLEIKPKLILT